MKTVLLCLYCLLFAPCLLSAQPDWPAIKASARFTVADADYGTPYVQPLNVGGWEDGLYISRDGLRLYCTYLPADVLSLIGDFVLRPACFDFRPYFRPPLLDIDTLTNPWGCPNFFQSDIVIAERERVDVPFSAWKPSNLARSVTMEGGAQGVPSPSGGFDYFVFTRNGDGHTEGDEDMQILMLRDVDGNPSQARATPIVETPEDEDNPHLERVDDSTLVLFFDRGRHMHYATSRDSGRTWSEARRCERVLNDLAPFDTQPHLWHDGSDWWVFFRASGEHLGPGQYSDGIYKARQTVPGDWDSWGEKQLVIAAGDIETGSGPVVALGEPSLTRWGDLSFVVIYAQLDSPDTTDVFDADPWFLPRKGSPVWRPETKRLANAALRVYPCPADDRLNVEWNGSGEAGRKLQISDALGRVVWRGALAPSVDIGDLPAGLYRLQLEGTDAGAAFLKK